LQERFTAPNRTVARRAFEAEAAQGERTCAPDQATGFERLEKMSDTDRDRHQLYLYRRWPRISKTDSPPYTGVLRQAIDDESTLHNYGSGRDSCRLNDRNKTIAGYSFEVHDLNRPPRLDPAELID
jgi:hypothetical protein